MLLPVWLVQMRWTVSFHLDTDIVIIPYLTGRLLPVKSSEKGRFPWQAELTLVDWRSLLIGSNTVFN